MSDTGMTELERKINQFEQLLEDMKEATRESHSTLKSIRDERREIEKLLTTDAKKLVHERVDTMVTNELDRIGPEIRKMTNMIYDKVGKEIDKIIDISLGKEKETRKGKEDLRPILADRMKEWIREVMSEEGFVL